MQVAGELRQTRAAGHPDGADAVHGVGIVQHVAETIAGSPVNRGMNLDIGCIANPRAKCIGAFAVVPAEQMRRDDFDDLIALINSR